MNGRPGDRLRAIGWLLMPLVVWAASFLGAWFGAVVATRFGWTDHGMAIVAAGALIASAIAVLAWWRLLRRRKPRRTPPTDA